MENKQKKERKRKGKGEKKKGEKLAGIMAGTRERERKSGKKQTYKKEHRMEKALLVCNESDCHERKT